jgi:hypothetical protein
MSENLRSLAVGLRKSVKGLVGAPQRQVSMPISVSIDLERKTASLSQNAAALTVSGQTQEMSKNGIAFVLPFVRIGDHYIAGHGGEQKRLKLVLELPNGTVRMTAQTERMEMLELHDSVQQYLIGVKIVEINEGDRERYEDFIKRGDKAVQSNAADLSSEQKKGSLFGFLYSIF